MKVAAVVPCYRVKEKIAGVLAKVGNEVSEIIVVDDCCPEHTGDFVSSNVQDKRVHVIKHAENQGVGGAMISGISEALRRGADLVVKIDGDGQMDPALVKKLIQPITSGHADFVKGNRFYYLSDLPEMPKLRLIGNAALSFITKLSSGYWHVMDPTNGLLAISGRTLELIPYQKLHRRYFFESDLLFRLYTVRAVIKEMPMRAVYGDEQSSLSIWRVLLSFPFLHTKNFLKRIFYAYFLRDFNMGTLSLVLGSILTGSGLAWGIFQWIKSEETGAARTAGTVMLSALPIILGIQMLFSFLQFDILNTPKEKDRSFE